MTFDLVVFDMDKTLLYPARPFSDAFQLTFNFPISNCAQAWISAVTYDGVCTGLEAVQAVLPHASKEEHEVKCRQISDAWADCQVLYPGTLEMLASLRDSYSGKIAILTNGPSRFQRHIIEKFGLNKYVDFIFTSGDADVARRKPSVDCFSILQSRTGVSAERCLMIGNSAEEDCIAAMKAGWSSIWVNPSTEGAPQFSVNKVASEFLQLAQRELGNCWVESWQVYTGKPIRNS